jgi:ubiquinone biosynthesis protein COQ4
MTATILSTDLATHKNWGQAFTALRRLLADANDTAQVFRIMQALNAGASKNGYDRLLKTAEGGRIAYEHVELAERFSDPEFVASFPEGTLGATYRAFLEETGYSAQGLAEVSRTDGMMREGAHPYAWFGRRTRDVHDIWHLLTGYRADDPLGEACLTAFSFAQTGGLGWAMIATGAAVRSLVTGSGTKVVKAIWEGFRNGRRAAWLQGEDYERLLTEPLDLVRARLNIAKPMVYDALREQA